MTRILIVDDERLISWSLGKAISVAGFDVAIAESGEEALCILKSSHVDLLITDATLPELNGCTLAAEAKRMRPSMPVILISAKDQAAELACGGSLIDYSLSKPFNLPEIVGLVRKLTAKDSTEAYVA